VNSIILSAMPFAPGRHKVVANAHVDWPVLSDNGICANQEYQVMMFAEYDDGFQHAEHL
jgi:hypothetical protein